MRPVRGLRVGDAPASASDTRVPFRATTPWVVMTAAFRKEKCRRTATRTSAGSGQCCRSPGSSRLPPGPRPSTLPLTHSCRRGPGRSRHQAARWTLLRVQTLLLVTLSNAAEPTEEVCHLRSFQRQRKAPCFEHPVFLDSYRPELSPLDTRSQTPTRCSLEASASSPLPRFPWSSDRPSACLAS